MQVNHGFKQQPQCQQHANNTENRPFAAISDKYASGPTASGPIRRGVDGPHLRQVRRLVKPANANTLNDVQQSGELHRLDFVACRTETMRLRAVPPKNGPGENDNGNGLSARITLYTAQNFQSIDLGSLRSSRITLGVSVILRVE